MSDRLVADAAEAVHAHAATPVSGTSLPDSTGPVTPGAALPARAAALPVAQPPRPALPDAPPELTLSTLERAGLVVGRSVRTRVSEEFRIAVGRIARASEETGEDGLRNPLVLVTSARPGEGKTFTAMNIAAVLAQNGPRPVVLVDTDFKQEGLSDILGLGGRRGLYDVLDEDIADAASLLVTTEVPGLSVLPAGTFAQDEMGSGFTRPLGRRVETLATAFRNRTVILDAPPCLSTSDPSTLAGLAGQALLVVEAGRTQRAEVEAALDFVQACPLVTVLLNKVRQSNRQTFGSYDYLNSYQ